MKKSENEFEDIEPIEFLELAYELEKNKDKLNSSDSAITRNIYTRIYYCVFLFLREWLKSNTEYYSFPKGEHSRLAKFIRRHGPLGKELNEKTYKKLTQLKRLRHQADYNLEVPSRDSQQYKNWEFISIFSAFEIAEDIIRTFKEF